MKLGTAVVIAFSAFSMGCGASLHAVYEGDVRFERCMSLDVQPQVAAGDVRDCWEDWVAFYTYGQTRDRVLHAQLRIKQLSGDASSLPTSGKDDPLTTPGPSSANAPPPMMAE